MSSKRRVFSIFITFIFISVLSLTLVACERNDNNATTPTTSAIVANTTKESLADSTTSDGSAATIPKTDDPMAIANLFPDPVFASIVAELFNKKVTDTVTFDELAAYDGELVCGSDSIESEKGVTAKSLEGIGYLKGVTSFSCFKNNVEELPDEIGNLENLEKINLLKAFSLTKISPEIKKLKKLKYLRLDLSGIDAIPPEIGELESLEVLWAGAVQNVKSIPKELGNLKNLKVLDLHGNALEEIPDEISNLSNLVYLDLGYNEIKTLPSEIGNLSKLESLNLFGLKLESLPSGVKNLTNLRYLNVYDNFSLNEDYKDWFAKSVYECTDDPKEDADWYDFA